MVQTVCTVQVSEWQRLPTGCHSEQGKRHGLLARLKHRDGPGPESLIKLQFITWFIKARTFRQTPHQADLEEEGLCLAYRDSMIASLGLHIPAAEIGPCMVSGVSLCPARKVPAPPPAAENFVACSTAILSRGRVSVCMTFPPANSL